MPMHMSPSDFIRRVNEEKVILLYSFYLALNISIVCVLASRMRGLGL